MDNFVSLGLQLPLIVTFSIFAGLLLIALALFFIGRWDFDSGWTFGGIFFGAFAVILGIVWLIMLVPFDAKYHQIYRVSGEVLSVSNVLSESGGDLTRTPVITLEGVDRDITMDDPRAVNLQGKEVELTCGIAWHYQAADTYSCSIYAIK